MTSTLVWPARGPAQRTEPQVYLKAHCDRHGPTVAHTGLYPSRDPNGMIAGWQAPVFAGCCNRLLGYLPPQTQGWPYRRKV